MNKLELIQALKDANGLTKTEAEAVVNIFFDAMSNALANGDRVEIRGLCSIFVKEYGAYTGRTPKTGEKVYTLATGFSLMVFYAFAMQCMSTLAVVKRETKSWKWPVIQFFYMFVLAYGASLLTYNLLA